MYREDVGGGENDVTVTYTYDANGMRIGKTVTTNTYHAHSYTAVVTAPTCTVDGYTTYTCSCGDSYVGDVTDATGHTYTETVTAPTCTEGGYTTYTCACGDSYTGNTTAALGHELVETTVDGSVLYTCNRCDYTATHVHSYTAAVTAPTCTVEGYTTYTCSCGDSYQGDVVAATGHNGSFLISEPATCTEDGYEDYYCQTCGEVYTIVLPAPGHTWTEGGLVPYCTVCNYGRTGDPAFWSLRNTDLVSSVEETYSYVYNGSLLMQMTVTTSTTEDGNTTTTTDILDFTYDASGRPVSVTWNGVTYYYAVNLQGDVLAILDSAGVPVASYSYDAWGNHLTGDRSGNNIGALNPLRYRGYVWDTETSLYYLQSRYYNPEWGRFINADGYTSTGGLLGNNMFSYCINNPVNSVDFSGAAAVSIYDGDRNLPLINYIGLGGGGTCGHGGFARKASSRDKRDGLIFNQSRFRYSGEAVGLGSYASSGCAVIATYNAMQLLGNNTSLGAVRDEYLWKHGTILFGLLGVGPWSIDNYFESHGINYTGYSSYTSLNANIAEGDVVVFTVMNDQNNIFEGFHTMAAQYIGGTYIVFNAYSNRTVHSVCPDLNNIYPNQLWIYGYIVGG